MVREFMWALFIVLTIYFVTSLIENSNKLFLHGMVIGVMFCISFLMILPTYSFNIKMLKDGDGNKCPNK